jgi:Flp pilus assembly protein TadD
VAAAGFEADVGEGWELARAGESAAAIEHFQALVGRCPNEPRAHFELAGALDFAGREAEAVAPYRRAMALGLAGDDVPRWYVQLGSTLRNVGAGDEAVAVLTEGRDRFPDDAAIRVFRALALHSTGRDGEALVELLDLVLTRRAVVGLRGYERTIGEYTHEVRAEGERL